MLQSTLSTGARPAAKLSTEELAARLAVKPTSIRSAYCRHGHYFGLVPVKLPNRRLLWDPDEVAALTAGKVAA